MNGSFVLGFDDDGSEVFATTAQWIEENRLECATFYIFIPYPGTPLSPEMEREGRLLHRDWSRLRVGSQGPGALGGGADDDGGQLMPRSSAISAMGEIPRLASFTPLVRPTGGDCRRPFIDVGRSQGQTRTFGMSNPSCRAASSPRFFLHSLRILSGSAVLGLALALSGCVMGSPPAALATPTVRLTGLHQLAGLYEERSVDPQHPGRHLSLFAFLTGQQRSRNAPGQEVELRPSPDGPTLLVRLLDGQGREVATASLRQPGDFTLTETGLELHGRADRSGITSSNLGGGYSSQHRQIRSTAGALVGFTANQSVGLLFFVVPIATSSDNVVQWRRR